MKNRTYKTIALLGVIFILIASACKKKDYFVDGGLAQQSEAEKSMSTYDFLAGRSNHMFDSLVKIINLTNTKALVNTNNITFYAAPNEAVIRFQQRLNAADRLAPRPLSKIGLDTLKLLLNRFIIPGNRITLEQVVADKLKTYKDNNTDSINIVSAGGGINAGSSIQTSAFRMYYEHRKIKKVDSVNYGSDIQTHNLITANARVHVLVNGANFACGLKLKYYR
jgi:hypothetical protein